MLFLLRLNIGKKPAPAPNRRRVRSPPDGLHLDHLRPHVREHHPTRGAHHHVRELDDPQSRQRLRRNMIRPAHDVVAAAVGSKVFGNPARQSVPCSGSPSSHFATRARNESNLVMSIPVVTPMLAKR